MTTPKQFSVAQQTQFDRFSAARAAQHTEKKLVKLSADAIRAKVNIIGIGGDGPTFSPEDDYTAEERAWIEAWGVRSRWAEEIPKRLAQAHAMKAEGAGNEMIKAVLGGP